MKDPIPKRKRTGRTLRRADKHPQKMQPDPDPFSILRSLLSELESAQSRRSQLEDLRPKLEARQKHLIETSMLDEASQVSPDLSCARTKVEILPFRIQQVEEEIASLEDSLSLQSITAEKLFLDRAHRALRLLKAQLGVALKPFYRTREDMAPVVDTAWDYLTRGLYPLDCATEYFQSTGAVAYPIDRRDGPAFARVILKEVVRFDKFVADFLPGADLPWREPAEASPNAS